MSAIPFNKIGILPKPTDNCAVAIDRIEEGTQITLDDKSIVTLDHTCLEGHRFAIKLIKKDEHLYSWGLEFGTALCDIHPGNYIINQRGLDALKLIDPSLKLPTKHNFNDNISAFKFDKAKFQSVDQIPTIDEVKTFPGYNRGGRGVGTRNYILILSGSSVVNSLVKSISDSFREKLPPNIDGVVYVQHTEGNTHDLSNNHTKILSILSGYILHPNIGGTLVVTAKGSPITNEALQNAVKARIPPESASHYQNNTFYLSYQDNFKEAVKEGINFVKKLVTKCEKIGRTQCPYSALTLALQCGGSDAFSGVSANPLQGMIAKKIIGYGGRGVLAETDELIGADSYILSKVKDLETVNKYQQIQDSYDKYTKMHGMSAQSNPSGGNFYRGLYNIVIKSLGAAMKKPDDVRLDGVLEYGEPAPKDRGYFMMDSPGNDIESVAGQVASGCNVVLFSTGNGSITNHPFVPIIKIMTTTTRFNQMSGDIDINAGELMDGIPFDVLSNNTFDYLLRVAGGEKTRGECAKHYQTQIWRNYMNKTMEDYTNCLKRKKPTQSPYPIVPSTNAIKPIQFQGFSHNGHTSQDEVALILPTSLCSAQVAVLFSDQLNKILDANNEPTQPNKKAKIVENQGNMKFGDFFTRFVALPHTEGCGEGYGDHPIDGIELYNRVMIGHMIHPNVRNILLLEHGCEKTLITHFEKVLKDRNLNIDNIGKVSIQRDGGIDKSKEKVINHFSQLIKTVPASEFAEATLDNRIIGIYTDGELPPLIADTLIEVMHLLSFTKSCVVQPINSTLLGYSKFKDICAKPLPTLLCGDQINSHKNGFLHIMDVASDSYVETLTCLVATGMELCIVYSNNAICGHPLIPVIKIGVEGDSEVDMVVKSVPGSSKKLMTLIQKYMDSKLRCYFSSNNNVGFQIPRTDTGVSL